MRGFPAVAALLELLLAQVVEVRVDVLVQDLIADAGVGGEGDCGEVDVDARRRRAVLIVLILFQKEALLYAHERHIQRLRRHDDSLGAETHTTHTRHVVATVLNLVRSAC